MFAQLAGSVDDEVSGWLGGAPRVLPALPRWVPWEAESETQLNSTASLNQAQLDLQL